MKTIKNILLYIWQIPQNIVAVVWSAILCIFYKKPEVEDYKGVKYIWFNGWRNGVSLGHYVILGTYYKRSTTTINHEYGHTRQSLYLGPLYLFLIGLPSGTWNLIDRVLSNVNSNWTYKRANKVYYSMPWEHWADKLGGVERNFD